MRKKFTVYRLPFTVNERGFVLLLTFIFMITMMGIVAAYLSLVHHGTRAAGLGISDEQAFYLADAGIHYAIFMLQLDSSYDGDENDNLIFDDPHFLPSGNSFKMFILEIEEGDGVVNPLIWRRIRSTGLVYSASYEMISSRTIRQDVTVP